MAKINAKPWHEIVRLRDDIKSGKLTLNMFAADLYDVMLERNPDVYHDPHEFFALTYPTLRLRDLARDVTRRLAGKSDKAVRHLHITFGGGKTHALIALVHLVKDPASLPDVPSVREFKAHCGIEAGLPQARIAAVVFDRLDAEKGMEVKAPNGRKRVFKMPWSLLAWQLAGEEGLKLLKGDGDDERRTPPATNVIEELLAHTVQDASAVLILFDEVLWFVRTMVDQDPGWSGRMTDFLHSLTQAVVKTDCCCLVSSLLASDLSKMDKLGRQLSTQLYEEFKRVADEGIQPVESQDVPEILRRRLFTPESCSDKSLWKGQVVAALSSIAALDNLTKTSRAGEEERYFDAYPFHPDLVHVFFAKWTQLQGFQQTRGILRTLAMALQAAEKWDRSPLAGAQVFLASPGEERLSDVLGELAATAQLEQYKGRQQYWPAILEAEFEHARRAQEGLGSLNKREIEQAVVATFLHSQPIGQQASARDLKHLVGCGTPDGIELNKGLEQWAETSWYLDDTFIGDREFDLPKLWRLGSKPNLKQMHHDARRHVASDAVSERLEKAIRNAKKLTEGARNAGVKVHVLPARPADIEDDGEFHYAVLGPDAASESGKPSTHAKRFIDETTSPERPRARNRNAVVLAVPSKDGVEVAREKVRDILGWEKVQESLKRDDMEATTKARLSANLQVAKNEMASHVLMAYCIAITVNDENKIAAYRIGIDNEPLFGRLVEDERLRIAGAAISAEALLPKGPYDLWADGEQARLVEHLVGAFAATAKLPKMLRRDVILETLLQGCEAGAFVLRVTRPNKSVRTFWKTRPDEVIQRDQSLEVVLSDAATLTEIDSAILVPAAFPELWHKTPITLAGLASFFSGEHQEEIDRGTYKEELLIPAAEAGAIKVVAEQAIKEGKIWLVNGAASVCGGEVPAGLLNEQAEMYPPPAPIEMAALLQENLEGAWEAERTTARLIYDALSAKAGKPLPWTLVRAALDDGFRLGLFERTGDSVSWPCDLGGADAVKIRLAEKSTAEAAHPTYSAPATELETGEIQELYERIGELRAATAGHTLRIKVAVEIGEPGKVDKETIEKANEILDAVKPGWRVGGGS